MRPWSKFDLRWLKRAFKEGLSVEAIASELMRTRAAIEAKRRELGMVRKHREARR
jgi:hypothetical protein